MVLSTLVNFIKVDLEQSRTRDTIKTLVLFALDKTFILGENCIEKLSAKFTVTKVQNFDYIYEYLPENNKIRIIDRKTGSIIEVENNLKFDSEPIPKVIFNETVKKHVLFGLDEVAKDLYANLNCPYNKLICLQGPRGSGKRLLLKNMEIELENKQFLWFDDLDIKCDENYLLKLIDEITSYSVDVVLCYLPNPEILINPNYDQGHLYKTIELLLSDRFLRINIVISCENVNLLPWILKLAFRGIPVRNLNLKEKTEFIKYLIKTKTGRDKFEDEFEMISRALNGFTARDIDWFIKKVQSVDPNLSLTEMMKCSKNKEFIPDHLSKFKIDPKPLHWNDIGGYDSVKQQLREEIEIPLKEGKTTVRGVLLHGPPGCSKTMFARAIATECQIGLFVISPSTVLRSIVGQSEQILSEIIEMAEASAPSIIFIDEIDMILPQRSGDEISVQCRLLNQLMTFMDGIHSKKENKVIVIAATNNFELVDEALKRPGRMDLNIKIDLPDQIARESILKMVFTDQHYKVDSEVIKNIPLIAKLLENQCGASIVEFGNRVKNLFEMSGNLSNEFIPDSIITMNHICKILSDKFQIDNILI